MAHGLSVTVLDLGLWKIVFRFRYRTAPTRPAPFPQIPECHFSNTPKSRHRRGPSDGIQDDPSTRSDRDDPIANPRRVDYLDVSANIKRDELRDDVSRSVMPFPVPQS